MWAGASASECERSERSERSDRSERSERGTKRARNEAIVRLHPRLERRCPRRPRCPRCPCHRRRPRPSRDRVGSGCRGKFSSAPVSGTCEARRLGGPPQAAATPAPGRVTIGEQQAGEHCGSGCTHSPGRPGTRTPGRWGPGARTRALGCTWLRSLRSLRSALPSGPVLGAPHSSLVVNSSSWPLGPRRAHVCLGLQVAALAALAALAAPAALGAPFGASPGRTPLESSPQL